MWNRKKLINDSKFLALVLRHKPETIGITLDEHGWTDIDTLIRQFQPHRQDITLEELQEIVRTDNKGRYTISPDGKQIRAAQGHSLNVDLELKPIDPPPVLYHGTGQKSVSSILATGLKPMSRQYVHLSADITTARKVGERHGKPVIFELDIPAMKNDGILFYQAENGVYLTNSVPPQYLKQIEP